VPEGDGYDVDIRRMEEGLIDRMKTLLPPDRTADEALVFDLESCLCNHQKGRGRAEVLWVVDSMREACAQPASGSEGLLFCACPELPESGSHATARSVHRMRVTLSQ
jgi:hypothetical protein